MRFIDLPIRCGLCRFALEDGEHIVVIHKNGQVSKKYKFVSTEIIDDESEIWYKPCKYGRNELDPADAVHRSCFNEAAPDAPNLHALIRNPVTTYSCEPPTEEERRRAYWYRAWFATTLSALFRCYPISSAPELLYMIAAHCVQNLAARSTVLLGLESMTSNSGKRTGTVDASKDIWVTKTCFEGYKYIKTLANERPLCGEAILLREENPDQAVVTVYVAEDHLGVRDIVFCGPGKLAAEERPGVWWRTIKGDESILWENDGWKLRRVTNIVCSNWVASKPTRSISRVYFLMSFQAKELKLASPYRSDIQPTSYSFCWNRHLQSIHAQTSNNTTASVYKNHPNSVVWLHVPICDKYISEIWLRKIRGQPCALVLVLQDGETHVIGPYPRRSWHEPSYFRLDQQESGCSLPLFDNNSMGDICALAFLSEDPTSNMPLALALPTPNTCYPPASPHEVYFWSYAELDQLVEIAPCRSSLPGCSIAGLLLTYASGRQASVGIVRLDYLDRPQSMDKHTGFWLCFQQNEPQICAFSLIPPTSPGYLHIQCQGRLEWWYSYRQCRVHYRDQASPPPRI